MDKRSFEGIAQFYFARYAYRQPSLPLPPSPDLKTIVVIPCHREPDVLATLNSLQQGQPTKYPVEVLVVVNQSEQAGDVVAQQHRQAIEQIGKWATQHRSEKMAFYCLEELAMPAKHAGVGLARKAGMDEALSRFRQISQQNGAIVCLDADCLVSPNYLSEIESQFSLSKTFGLATIPFEHRLGTIANPHLQEGIIRYELFLRYYVEGLRFAQYPFAFHTIGSSMAVKAQAYARHQGMNRRKAGEDFYFLHEIAPHEKHLTLKKAKVYPSARLSDRVPFGTGKAQQDWIQGKAAHQATYHPAIFQELKDFLLAKDELFVTRLNDHGMQVWPRGFPKNIRDFLDATGFVAKWKGMLNNTASLPAFQKQFFLWLDGFQVLKFVHFCHQGRYPALPLEEAAQQLADMAGFPVLDGNEPEALLALYRNLNETTYGL